MTYGDGAPDATDVLVVGGGAAGALVAAAIARHDPTTRVAVVERRYDIGRGIAYGTTDDAHLLNVRASCMSAFPDRPDHFVDWARAHHSPACSGDDFLPRRVYGDYLQDVFAGAEARGCIEAFAGEVVALRRDTAGWQATIVNATSGTAASTVTTGSARAVVLAVGHGPSAPLPVDHPDHRAVDDPWRPGALDAIDVDDDVALVGTGLTAVDVIVTLARRQHRGRVIAISRHGLFSHPHPCDPVVPAEPPALAMLLDGRLPLSARALVHALRADARGRDDWRATVDGVRAITPSLWRALPLKERARLLRHARRHWDVHRHRMAPAVAAVVEERRRRGRLLVERGRVERCTTAPVGVRVHTRSGGYDVAYVVNCTGPRPAHESNPLVARLVATGILRVDPLGLGVDVTADGCAVDASGQVDHTLQVVGPLRTGSDWESTAVPEIRLQAAIAAASVCGAGQDDDDDDASARHRNHAW